MAASGGWLGMRNGGSCSAARVWNCSKALAARWRPISTWRLPPLRRLGAEAGRAHALLGGVGHRAPADARGGVGVSAGSAPSAAPHAARARTRCTSAGGDDSRRLTPSNPPMPPRAPRPIFSERIELGRHMFGQEAALRRVETDVRSVDAHRPARAALALRCQAN
jgi:hypothetical protein